MLVPPPPSRDVQAAMLAQMRRDVALRTPERTARAQVLNQRGALQLWMEQAADFRREVGPLRGWVGTGKMTAALGTALVASMVPKLRHREARPFVQDPTLPTIGTRPVDPSYPSAHATMSTAAAETLAGSWPDRADQLRALAREVGEARVYSAVHFPTDVTAGARLGLRIAQLFR